MKLLREDVEAVLTERIEADAGFNPRVYVYFRTLDNRVFVTIHDWVGDVADNVVPLGDVTEWDDVNYFLTDLSREELIEAWETKILERIKEVLNDDGCIVFYDTHDSWSDAYDRFDAAREETLGKGWNVVCEKDGRVWLEHDDGREKIVDRDEIDFDWETADDYANDVAEWESRDAYELLDSLKFEGPLVCKGVYQRWNGVFNVAKVVETRSVTEVFGYLESADRIRVEIEKSTKDLIVTLYDHDGWARVAVREIDKDAEFDETYADACDVAEFWERFPEKTRPIGNDLHKAQTGEDLR